MTRYAGLALVVLAMLAATGCFPQSLANPNSKDVQAQDSDLIYGRAMIDLPYSVDANYIADSLMENQHFNGNNGPYMLYRVGKVQGKHTLVAPFVARNLKGFKSQLERALDAVNIKYQIIESHHGVPKSNDPLDGRNVPSELEGQQEDLNEWG